MSETERHHPDTHARTATWTRACMSVFRGVVLVASGSGAVSVSGVAHAQDLLGVDGQVARLEVCYDFGCKSTEPVYILETEWQPFTELLEGARSPEDERRRIARAVAAMERLVGLATPTGADRGGNDYEGDDPSGQMDCIDESRNTTAYLKLFQDYGLLTWHRVAEAVYRAPVLLDQHWAARIEERGSGEQFAVDSWPRDNGELPLVQTVAEWRRDVGSPSPSVVVGTAAEAK